jgi:hypothetical protein
MDTAQSLQLKKAVLNKLSEILQQIAALHNLCFQMTHICMMMMLVVLALGHIGMMNLHMKVILKTS